MGLKNRPATFKRVLTEEGLGGVFRLFARNTPGVSGFLARMFPTGWKHWNELSFWRLRRRVVKGVPGHYEQAYTGMFDLDADFYRGKRILDIGCGPMGSLEWADMAAVRVGVDPLAREYLKLGAASHKMTYVAASSESLPFDDASFDVISIFNTLDHVDDVEQTVREVERTLAPGGLLLLLTEVGHEPTPCEPHALGWDVLDLFGPEMTVLLRKHFETEGSVYGSVLAGERFDHDNPVKRPGTLMAKLCKRHGGTT